MDRVHHYTLFQKTSRKPYSHYHDIRGHASQPSPILPNISFKKTFFPLVPSRTKNLLEICSPVDFMVDLERRRTTRNRIPTFVTTNFTGFLPHVHLGFNKKGPLLCHTVLHLREQPFIL